MTERFKARSAIIFFIFNALYFVIILNLYYIQIKHHDIYAKLAQQQYNVSITQIPPRGLIYDRTGNNYFALNKNYLSAFILPLQLVHQEKLITFLHNYFPDAYHRLHNNKEKHFIFIKRHLSPQEQTLIKTSGICDIKLLSEPGRYYPIACATPLIGITNVDNRGIMGLELACNHILAGNPTIHQLEKDARSGYYYFKKETSVHGDLGQDIHLTLDADLQFLSQEALHATITQFNAQEGAIIIINPVNGEIISLVSYPYPYCDPHNNEKIPADLDLNLYRNRAITDTYELGSVIKVFAALAALEEKVVTPDELIDCKNSKTTYIDGRKINTVHAHGIIPFTDVVAYSNNIGIAIIAKRLGGDLYNHYKKLGFGSKTGIFFPGESSGFVNPPENWSKQSIISLSYGYEITATLLQLACAFCIIATGYTVTPRLLLHQSTDTTPTQTRLYSAQSIATIQNILEKTTHYGTARRAAIKGYRVMSKTGTANMLVDGKYVPEKNMYTCAGIIEKDTYQRVIVVFVKEAQHKNLYAATVAAPLFEAVAEQMLIHDHMI